MIAFIESAKSESIFFVSFILGRGECERGEGGKGVRKNERKETISFQNFCEQGRVRMLRCKLSAFIISVLILMLKFMKLAFYDILIAIKTKLFCVRCIFGLLACSNIQRFMCRSNSVARGGAMGYLHPPNVD